MSGSVIAVVAHPDDESLIAGGTLALAALAGARTGVVALTRGEHGPISPACEVSRRELPDVRENELQAAAQILGVTWTRCLHHPDGELPWVDWEAAAAELAALLAPHEPSAILTFGEDGLYGHPDHAAARSLVLAALERLSSPPAVYEAAWPYGIVTELAVAARRQGLGSDLWGIEPEAFGCERPANHLVDVRSVLPRKLAAIRAHRTQIAPGHLLAELPLEIAERFLAREPWAGPERGPLEELLAGG